MILANDESVRFYTGVPCKYTLIAIFETVKKRATRIDYWKGPKSRNKSKLDAGPGGRRKLIDHFDEYLLTLVYIRQGITVCFLSDMFGVSVSTVTCIVNTWINVLYQIMKNWLIWPSAQQVRSTLPKNYPAKYADTRVILDCTEFFHVKPQNCSAQASTYSQYKHQNTVKVMIGITPRGLITFISQPYGGNTSDRHIAEKEILHKIEPGDAVMVDRGFNIGDLLVQRGAKLHMPPFTRKREDGKGRALNQSEILKTREIAALRIHVERAIERMKNFKILTNKVNFHLWPLLYQILVVVALLCNLQPPLLKY
ncbi:MAG: hypothetical protein DSY42_03545 [Aquifex sp.]|nr:MAG: hypothetical protein DSY42_03545 [Aquifex sp.]